MSVNESSLPVHSLTLAKAREVVAVLDHVPTLPNGEPAALLMRQQSNLVWISTGKAFPLITGAQPDSVEDVAVAIDRKEQYLAWGRLMLQSAVVAQRAYKPGEDGQPGETYWAPTVLVGSSSAAKAGDAIAFPVADVSDETIEAAFDALCNDYNNGGPFRKPEPATGDTTTDSGNAVSDGGEVPLPSV